VEIPWEFPSRERRVALVASRCPDVLPLLPDDPPENVFQRSLFPGDMFAEGLVDQV
jgi:hypothetical protein